MKLELQKTYPGDKELLIIDTEGVLCICIDYDDVNHEKVMRDALALIKKVNMPNADSQRAEPSGHMRNRDQQSASL